MTPIIGGHRIEVEVESEVEAFLVNEPALKQAAKRPRYFL
jgi:hypothetical protein